MMQRYKLKESCNTIIITIMHLGFLLSKLSLSFVQANCFRKRVGGSFLFPAMEIVVGNHCSGGSLLNDMVANLQLATCNLQLATLPLS
ncbi:Uncharacterized protein TCM_029409 [Theobroma cacao]|uniref:Uncharacterized protein n=1 Tax=Theobroma cacao TaxID=3641 RepID=A0A061GDU0_THECC|nr:Uncharacterized protein TCM_029409 [Theobroma cacao]